MMLLQVSRDKIHRAVVVVVLPFSTSVVDADLASSLASRHYYSSTIISYPVTLSIGIAVGGESRWSNVGGERDVCTAD